MIEQIGVAIGFYAMFIETRVGKTGLTVTVDVWRVNTSGSATEVVTGGSATEIGDGLYYYQLASGSVTVEGEYVAVFKTATSTVDQQHIPALWVVQKAGVEKLVNATDAVGLADDAITAAKIAADAIGSSELAASAANKIADHVRRRTQANVEASANGDALDLSSEYGFIQQAQESSRSGTTLTVKKTDGSTTLGTKTLATDSGAAPITGVS